MFRRFLDIAEARKRKLAISNEQCELTYAELSQQVQHLARALSLSVVKGRPPLIVLALPGGPHFTIVTLAALGANAVIVPVPAKVTPHEAKSYLRLLVPDLLVTATLEEAEPFLSHVTRPVSLLVGKRPESSVPEQVYRLFVWQDVLSGKVSLRINVPESQQVPWETRVVQFTSGSTGSPKGVLLSRKNLLANIVNNRKHLEGFVGQHVFCPIPQFHAMGFAVVLEHLCSGSAVHLANRFVPGQDARRMQRYACTSILASPNYFKLLLRLKVLSSDTLPAVRSVTIGTASVDTGLVSLLQNALPKAVVHIRYGLTEMVGALARLDLQPGEPLESPGLVGPPVPNTDLWPDLPVPDSSTPQEIRVRSEAVAIGQLTGIGEWSSQVDDCGFLATGDLGYLDVRGNLRLQGRLGTFLKRDGFRVSPHEIEEVLREIHGIHEAVVVGTPDAVSGQNIIACLEQYPGAPAIDPKVLSGICKNALSAHKVPQRFVTFESLPRTCSGKPDRQKIQSILGGTLPVKLQGTGH